MSVGGRILQVSHDLIRALLAPDLLPGQARVANAGPGALVGHELAAVPDGLGEELARAVDGHGLAEPRERLQAQHVRLEGDKGARHHGRGVCQCCVHRGLRDDCGRGAFCPRERGAVLGDDGLVSRRNPLVLVELVGVPELDAHPALRDPHRHRVEPAAVPHRVVLAHDRETHRLGRHVEADEAELALRTPLVLQIRGVVRRNEDALFTAVRETNLVRARARARARAGAGAGARYTLRRSTRGALGWG